MPQQTPHPKSSANVQMKLRQMERNFKAGEKLFIEGDPPGDMYILLAGSVKVLSRGVQVGIISAPGSYMGEMSVLLGEPRTATVVAQEDCRVLAVREKEIHEFLTHAPDLGLKLARGLADRLKHTNAAFAIYRREMSERFKNLSERSYKIFLLSKNPQSLQDMNWEIREAVRYIATLKPLDDDKKHDRLI